MRNSISIRAGRAALAQLHKHGLRAQDIAVIPAAAGGPKGLIFQRLDQWLFGHWLPSAPRERTLIGASVGAWRMAAACHADPVSAFQRLGDLYCEQAYPPKPSARFVTDSVSEFLTAFIGGHEHEIATHPHYRLHLLIARGRRLLTAPQRKLTASVGFGLAVLNNLLARAQLANHLERVVVADRRAPAAWIQTPFDTFNTHFAPLGPENLAGALLASGTLPFVMEPVRHIPDVPAGTYWDGGLIDYHLALPYARVADQADGGLVLYPHFGEQIVPGWFDKTLPWRRANQGKNRGWLDNMILVAPSPSFLQSLPRRQLPDRNDFHFYGQDNTRRMRDWKQAIGEGERLRDDLAAFVEKPDLGLVQPL